MNNRKLMHVMGGFNLKPKSPPDLRCAECCSSCKFGKLYYDEVRCEKFPDVLILPYEICNEFKWRKEDE